MPPIKGVGVAPNIDFQLMSWCWGRGRDGARSLLGLSITRILPRSEEPLGDPSIIMLLS